MLNNRLQWLLCLVFATLAMTGMACEKINPTPAEVPELSAPVKAQDTVVEKVASKKGPKRSKAIKKLPNKQDRSTLMAKPERRSFVATGDSPTFGDPQAPITIIEFSDFECPYCGRGAKTLKSLVKKFPKQVKVVFKHNPLPFHKFAKLAHKASIAAHKQGKFWEYHDLLFENRKTLTRADLDNYAKKIGLDMVKFGVDLVSPETQKTLDGDLATGRSVGVRGTPHFFLNGSRLSGAQPLKNFEESLKKEMVVAAKHLALGISPDKLYAEIAKKELSSSKPKAAPRGPKGKQAKPAAPTKPLAIQLAELKTLSVGEAPADPTLPGKVKPAPFDIAALQTTASGLQYFDHIVGTGDSPLMGETVEVHYTGWLTDGSVFDSSMKRGKTSSFELGRVIKGWNEGLQTMKAGGKRVFVIPADLAYGSAKRNKIPAGSVLVFEVSLIKVQKPLSVEEQTAQAKVLIAAGVPSEDPRLPGKEKPTGFDFAALKSMPSGLQYFDHIVGAGDSPKMGETVEVHYTGWLTDGTAFDSSVKRGKTTSFELGRVIKGWNEGLQTMRVGGKRTLLIPADLAYGKKGAGGVIPAGAMLIFEVSLIKIDKPMSPEEQAAMVGTFIKGGGPSEDPKLPGKEKPTAFDVSKLQSTASGLQFFDHITGEGDSPKMGDTVEVHYTGWLPGTGKVFDSSVKRGSPTSFQLGRVIKGWNEGLQTMKTGGKRTLVIPAGLAYGKRGMGQSIPPNSLLVFEVTLLKVTPKK